MRQRTLLGPLLFVALAGCASNESFELVARSSGEGTFKAGAAAVEFTPPKGYPLAGYGGGERRIALPLWWGPGWPGRLSPASERSEHAAGEAPCLLCPP